MIEKFCYSDFIDFFKKRFDLKKVYEASQNKRNFKQYVYSHKNTRLSEKDIIWEFLNGEVTTDFRKFIH